MGPAALKDEAIEAHACRRGVYHVELLPLWIGHDQARNTCMQAQIADRIMTPRPRPEMWLEDLESMAVDF